MQYLFSTFYASKPGSVLEKARVLIFDRLLPMILMLRAHLELILILRGHANIEILRRYPKIRYKYLLKNYLYENLPRTGAIRAMMMHYRTLGRFAGPGFVAKLFDSKIPLWKFERDETRFAISLAFPKDFLRGIHMYDHEGDLSLLFEMNGQLLYVITLAIVPGSILSTAEATYTAEKVMLIGRIQGVRGKEVSIRSATKELMEIAPPRMLLTAAEALAGVFGVNFIGGVSEKVQLSRASLKELESFFNYDEFWANMGATASDNGLFVTSCPIPEKDIEQILQKRRGRTLRKRQFRAMVRHEITGNIESQLRCLA